MSAASTNHAVTDRNLAVVVLAAGKGTRMKSALPKVLHEVLGRSVLDWVLSAVAPLQATRTVVVIGHGGDDVRAALVDHVICAVQEQQRGSGDALAAGATALEDFDGDVLVVNGDGALFTSATLQTVVQIHRECGSQATPLAISTDQDLPYGRVLQGDSGTVLNIIEAPDATPEQLAVRELNAGVYCFDAAALRAALPKLSDDNAKQELYITDLVGIVRRDGGTTAAALTGGEDELLGINTREDLAAVEHVLQQRILAEHMRAGVTFILPHTSLVEPGVKLEPDATIHPGCILRGSSSVAAGAQVGPYTSLMNTQVAENATVSRSECIDAQIGTGAQVGPFAYLRPGSVLGQGSKVGTFVELKKTDLAAGAKVPHLSYIGDASIGEGSNIGAGTITGNYRPELGRAKQRTTIGSNVRTGSNNVFVAPISIGNDAFTGAGSTIVEDVPAGALAIARARQVNLQDYSQRLKQRSQATTPSS